MADADAAQPKTLSFRKTLSSFLFGVIIVRIVNISVRAIATRITKHIDTNKIRGIFEPQKADEDAINTTAKNSIVDEDSSYVVYIEIFILVVILLITYLYGV